MVMGLDPIIARVGLQTAREVVSGRQISYPVPYILVILGVLCVACLIIGIFAVGPTQIIALIFACSAFAAAILF